MKIIYQAADITEAEIIKGMLVSKGVEASVSGFYLQGGIGELSPADLAKVHVSDEDYERAAEILQAYKINQSVQKQAEGNNSGLSYSQNFLVAIVLVVVAIVLVVVAIVLVVVAIISTLVYLSQ